MNKILIATCLLYFMVSCNSNEAEEKKSVDVEKEANNQDDDEPKNEVVYTIPSPNEQYDLLYMLGGEVDPTYVNELSRMSEYTTPAEKALNFGVYLSDAAYMMRYNQGKKVFLDYVSTLDEMGRDLDITQIYGEDLLKKVEETGANTEELFELSSDNYLKVFDQMIENDKGKELSLILSGAWIETMHILFESAGGYDNEFEIQESITDQRYVLENLLGFIGEYDENKDVKSMQQKLNKVLDAYDNLDCNETSVEVKEGDSDNSFVLDGGSSCLFTQDSYTEMERLIKEIRDSIIL